MGAEVGATTSTFGYDESMERYLRSTGRDDVADAANAVKEHLTADAEVYANPENFFDEVIEISPKHLRRKCLNADYALLNLFLMTLNFPK